MKFRKSDWLGVKSGDKLYGIDAYCDHQWMHVSQNGEPLFFKTAEERDAKLKLLRAEDRICPNIHVKESYV